MEQPENCRMVTQLEELLRRVEALVLSQRSPLLERKLMHYSSLHRILLVGEGNFSFSSSLANAFEFAHNIVATSLDSREKVLRVYDSAGLSISNLERRGALLLYEVDATRMHQMENLKERKFDRIVFNFPHIGIFGRECQEAVIKKNSELVSMFFKSSTKLLSSTGEIHVTHREGFPYSKWNIEGEAEKNGLFLKESANFRKTDYPGYMNKRGNGAKANRSFPLRECKTYMFSALEWHTAPSSLS